MKSSNILATNTKKPAIVAELYTGKFYCKSVGLAFFLFWYSISSQKAQIHIILTKC